MHNNIVTESKENIKLIRTLINEGSNSDLIIDAINQHKYLYIYYSGDDTVMQGYRIIMPFTIGNMKSGKIALRAWEIEGNSDTFYGKGVDKRRRLDHEYFIDGGKQIPGWRLFFIDAITKIFPTGKRFNTIPKFYNPNDKQMTSIIAAVQDLRQDTTVKSPDKITIPNQLNFKNINKDIVKAEVEDLYNVVKRIKKKSPDNYTIIIDDDGYKVIDNKNINKYSNENIVGGLRDLYTKLVLPYKPFNDNFHKKVRDRLFKDRK